MTNDGINSLGYDAENHATSSSGSAAGAYVYDGNGLRVQKCLPSCGGSNPNTVYVFSGAKVIAEYDNGAAVGSPSREYVYSGAALVARIDSSGTKYYHQDHLSNRYVTDSSGNKSAEIGTFPYGESWYKASSDKLLFTTYERDSESGNDYAQARYNVSGLGRFSSPDPIAGSTSDPQSLNRYSYVRNMPNMLSDPLGLFPGGCIPVARHSNSDHENQSVGDSKGHGPSAYESAFDETAEPPQGDCANAVNPAGGGVTVDGVDVTGIDGLLGSGAANADCPAGDCSLMNGTYTDNRGQAWSLWAGTDGLEWTNLANGDESEGESELGLPDLPDEDASPSWQRLLQTIASARLATALALLHDSKCLAFLGGTALPFLGNGNIVPTGYGGAGPVAAAVGSPPYIPGSAMPSYQININESGPFFKPGGLSGPTIGGRPMANASPRYQAFVLLHELGHVAGVLVPDTNADMKPDPVIEAKNNAAIASNCKNALSSLNNHAPKK